ncbi:MAG: DNA-processing protein DprA [Holosporaceae bacterium]|jgi:DNA processing protein|nr:DNA-processing protein DprA [Holosporaceae bacterium]
MLSKEEKMARLRLARSDMVGSYTFWSLINRYGSGEKALRAVTKSSHVIRSFELCDGEKIQKEIEGMKSLGARFVFFEDELYPPLLRNTPDPPPVLSFLGDREKVLSLYKGNMISVVGARNASIHANKFCHLLCQELSRRDVGVVSGLARGIDASAHGGSLENGTIAVLACGINIPYPQENLGLYNEIAQKGGLFTEMPLDTAPQPQLFPRRNRIIAGISYGTVVIEAAEQSGSLITARMALEYDRDVFAVPGFPLDPRSVGCNRLIKDGAIMVQSVQDILDHLENRKIIQRTLFENKSAAARPSDQDLEKIRKKIMDSLSSTPITIDELISSIKVSPGEALGVLLELELANKVVRLHGQRVCLALGD